MLLAIMEHGGTRAVIVPTSMASISLELIPPMLTVLSGLTGRDITTLSNSLR